MPSGPSAAWSLQPEVKKRENAVLNSGDVTRFSKPVRLTDRQVLFDNGGNVRSDTWVYSHIVC